MAALERVLIQPGSLAPKAKLLQDTSSPGLGKAHTGAGGDSVPR